MLYIKKANAKNKWFRRPSRVSKCHIERGNFNAIPGQHIAPLL